MFIDWITVKQQHLDFHKPYHGEIIAILNESGDKLLRTRKKKKLYEGSDSTSIMIHSDGYTVSVSGNIGRLNRPDNLFNYTLEQTMIKLNHLLAQSDIDLPPFTRGEIKFDTQEGTTYSTGARFTRLDLTCNYVLGSSSNALRYLTQLKQHKINRQKTRAYENTMYFGIGSAHKQFKIYNKSVDLKRILTKLIKQGNLENQDYLTRLIQYTHENGTLRMEVQYKEYLAKNNLAYWADVTHEKLTEHFEAEIMQLPKSCEKINITDLSLPVSKSLLLHISGENVKEHVARSTYYKHRRALLAFGIDINTPTPKSEILNFLHYVINVDLKELAQPSFYSLPTITNLKSV